MEGKRWKERSGGTEMDGKRKRWMGRGKGMEGKTWRAHNIRNE